MDPSDLILADEPSGSDVRPVSDAVGRSLGKLRSEQDAAHETLEATFHLAALHLICDPAGEAIVVSAMDRLDQFHRRLRDRQSDRPGDRGTPLEERTMMVADTCTLDEVNFAIGAIGARLEPPHDAPSNQALAHIDGAADCMARATQALAASVERSDVSGRDLRPEGSYGAASSSGRGRC